MTTQDDVALERSTNDVGTRPFNGEGNLKLQMLSNPFRTRPPSLESSPAAPPTIPTIAKVTSNGHDSSQDNSRAPSNQQGRLCALIRLQSKRARRRHVSNRGRIVYGHRLDGLGARQQQAGDGKSVPSLSRPLLKPTFSSPLTSTASTHAGGIGWNKEGERRSGMRKVQRYAPPAISPHSSADVAAADVQTTTNKVRRRPISVSDRTLQYYDTLRKDAKPPTSNRLQPPRSNDTTLTPSRSQQQRPSPPRITLPALTNADF
ncbi:hypothetical protein Hypma_013309 [Hypsizygus marmoreus]|uniref:Uncharacterized protein n=1 Tax=Hypsizygus marmoreus TaxID=39966 RepID=A0A369JBX8_HYPMA|nr:hypothetical protein Hypma_013309 [Hypsizygus marmoreus]